MKGSDYDKAITAAPTVKLTTTDSKQLSELNEEESTLSAAKLTSDSDKLPHRQVGFASTVETPPDDPVTYSVNLATRDTPLWNKLFKNPATASRYYPFGHPKQTKQLSAKARELTKDAQQVLSKQEITPADLAMLMVDSHKAQPQHLTDMDVIKRFQKWSVCLARTNPLEVFDEQSIKQSETNEQLYHLVASQETVAWMAAHKCFGDVWKYRPGTNDIPKKASAPKAQDSSVANPYKAQKTYFAVQAPMLPNLKFDEGFASPTPASSTREGTKMISVLLKALQKGDTRAQLVPITGSRMTYLVAKDVPKDSNKLKMERIKHYLPGFVARSGMPDDRVSCRMCIRHYKPISEIIAAVQKYTAKESLPFELEKDIIQDKEVVTVGWLKGSFTRSVNLESLTKAMRDKLSADQKNLQFRLENRWIKVTEKNRYDLTGREREALQKAQSQATHVVVAKSQALQVQTALMDLYLPGRQAEHYPLYRPYSFVAQEVDGALGKDAITNYLKLCMSQASMTRKISTSEVTSIKHLDMKHKGTGATLREAMMALSDPFSKDKQKLLLKAVDWKVLEPEVVVVTFKSQDQAKVAAAMGGLPKIMERHFGEEVYDWFVPGTKDTMDSKYKYDPDNNSYMTAAEIQTRHQAENLGDEAASDSDEEALEVLVAVSGFETDTNQDIIAGMRLLLGAKSGMRDPTDLDSHKSLAGDASVKTAQSAGTVPSAATKETDGSLESQDDAMLESTRKQATSSTQGSHSTKDATSGAPRPKLGDSDPHKQARKSNPDSMDEDDESLQEDVSDDVRLDYQDSLMAAVEGASDEDKALTENFVEAMRSGTLKPWQHKAYLELMEQTTDDEAEPSDASSVPSRLQDHDDLHPGQDQDNPVIPDVPALLEQAIAIIRDANISEPAEEEWPKLVYHFMANNIHNPEEEDTFPVLLQCWTMAHVLLSKPVEPLPFKLMTVTPAQLKQELQ